MKFSESWLREWVNPQVDTATLSEQLTMLGLEVDDISPVAGDFDKVVIGKVIECNQHPNADKLRVTKVDIGDSTPLSIVCGAENCRTGIIVAVATVGATLPGDFKIKAAKLRGEPSEGMLCSYSELAISDDHSGIIELPEDAPIGECLRKYLNLDDNIIEISVTPNRADANSIRGIARDVAVLSDIPFNEPQIADTASLSNPNSTIDVNVLAQEGCPIYLARVIENINVSAKTPLWMKEKLRRSGIRSIDPIVDVTNYVLLELGQPMHAFDRDKLLGGIRVRMANNGEKITLLDGSEVELTNDVLVIADEQKPIAMAGIFGGLHSGVTDQTKNIVLESAFFSPLTITGRARKYGLHTDASYRYERGVDFRLAHKAMHRATALLLDICGGEAGKIIEQISESHLPKTDAITLRASKMERLLGYAIASERVSPILTGLGCEVTHKKDENNQDTWLVNPPSWRFDIAIEEDLIEEVARIVGYNNIPTKNILSDLKISVKSESTIRLERIKQRLVDRGYHEIISYSFVDPKIQNLLHPNQPAEILPNPISSEMSAMRLSLLPGLLSTVQYNQNRQQTRLRLFESGLCFIPNKDADLGIEQKQVIGGVLTGNRFPEHWSLEKQHVDYFDAKGDLEALFTLTGNLNSYIFKPSEFSALHPGQSADIYLNNKKIGFIGVIHPSIEDKLGLQSKTVVFQVDMDAIDHKSIPVAAEISKYPANRRDIAIIVKTCVSAQEILQVCKKVGGNQLIDVKLFDVYDGKGIADGEKSLAISLILQDNHRTLTDEEISNTVMLCVSALKDQFAASLRE